MTWTDFNEYNSDVQFQIGQRIQKLRIDKKIAAVDLAAVEYYVAAEPPVRCGESHPSGQTEPPCY